MNNNKMSILKDKLKKKTTKAIEINEKF